MESEFGPDDLLLLLQVAGDLRAGASPATGNTSLPLRDFLPRR